MYTVEQFKADVVAECMALIEHATIEELSRLYNKIYPEEPDECIYGLMTGNCRSKRAKELIRKCCKASVSTQQFIAKLGIRGVIKHIDHPEKATSPYIINLSVLEAYIMLPEANIAAIQSYLTGQTETLEL